MKLITALSIFLVLLGCNTFGNMKTGLQKVQSSHIDVLISKIGYPTSKMEMGGNTLYTWTTTRNYTLTTPEMTEHSGTVTTGYGTRGTYSGYSMGSTTKNYRWNCRITVKVDKYDRIINSSYEGNAGACEHYAQALNKPTKTQAKDTQTSLQDAFFGNPSSRERKRAKRLQEIYDQYDVDQK